MQSLIIEAFLGNRAESKANTSPLSRQGTHTDKNILNDSRLNPQKGINLFAFKGQREKEEPVELKRDDHWAVQKHMEMDP